MTILVLGVGNPIIGDDGVGIYVARMLRERLRGARGVEFKELSVGGLKLVEEMLGYEEVYVLDSYSAPNAQPGRIHEFAPEQFEDTMHVSSPHGTTFAMALKLYQDLEPNKIPGRIRIFTVEIDPEFAYREGLSSPVREAASKLGESVAREIEHLVARR
jgi:hydrogenase maturation protease